MLLFPLIARPHNSVHAYVWRKSNILTLGHMISPPPSLKRRIAFPSPWHWGDVVFCVSDFPDTQYALEPAFASIVTCQSKALLLSPRSALSSNADPAKLEAFSADKTRLRKGRIRGGSSAGPASSSMAESFRRRLGGVVAYDSPRRFRPPQQSVSGRDDVGPAGGRGQAQDIVSASETSSESSTSSESPTPGESVF